MKNLTKKSFQNHQFSKICNILLKRVEKEAQGFKKSTIDSEDIWGELIDKVKWVIRLKNKAKILKLESKSEARFHKICSNFSDDLQLLQLRKKVRLWSHTLEYQNPLLSEIVKESSKRKKKFYRNFCVNWDLEELDPKILEKIIKKNLAWHDFI